MSKFSVVMKSNHGFKDLIRFFRGVLREGDQLLLGPSTSGNFQPVTVLSVKRNRASCRVVRAGQAASVAISGIDRNLLRKVSSEHKMRHLISPSRIRTLSIFLRIFL